MPMCSLNQIKQNYTCQSKGWMKFLSYNYRFVPETAIEDWKSLNSKYQVSSAGRVRVNGDLVFPDVIGKQLYLPDTQIPLKKAVVHTHFYFGSDGMRISYLHQIWRVCTVWNLRTRFKQ